MSDRVLEIVTAAAAAFRDYDGVYLEEAGVPPMGNPGWLDPEAYAQAAINLLAREGYEIVKPTELTEEAA